MQCKRLNCLCGNFLCHPVVCANLLQLFKNCRKENEDLSKSDFWCFDCCDQIKQMLSNKASTILFPLEEKFVKFLENLKRFSRYDVTLLGEGFEMILWQQVIRLTTLHNNRKKWVQNIINRMILAGIATNWEFYKGGY